MLTYSKTPKLQRKDRPWLLFLMAIIWIGGATFFHDPWEPYEPFVVAIVKSIIHTNSWLVPYLSHAEPYLELQPFYFWFFALIIKIFDFSNIPNAIRIINTLLIFTVIAIMGRVGSSLDAYKNGRTVVMILISSIGFINNAYQLSPNIVGLLGFALYIYALQNTFLRPGFCAWLLSISLILISINFNIQYIGVACVLLFLLPLLHNSWRARAYYLSAGAGCLLFVLFFASYAWQLNKVDHYFFVTWQKQYMNFITLSPTQWLDNLLFYGQTLAWYLIPGWFLLLWTAYKRRKKLWTDPILQLNCVLAGLLFCMAIISNRQDETAIFPLIVPVVLLASVEVDSIRISIVALLNWFSIFAFGVAGLCVITLYIALNFGHPQELLHKAQFYAPSYIFDFNCWQLLLALIISAIWLFMVTRKHIRGREMITNWASGTTFVLVVFISLCLPWFNAVLSFQAIVESSKPYLLASEGCVATNATNRLQNAIWYYYSGVRLEYEADINQGRCSRVLLVVNDNEELNLPGWHTLWSAKRPVDVQRYVLLERAAPKAAANSI